MPKAYFFDNDINNFQDRYLVPWIQPILIDDSGESKINKIIFKKYLKTLTLGPKLFGGYLLLQNMWEGYDPKSGLKGDLLDKFIELVKNKPQVIDICIFDWDRTLTLIEGIYTTSPDAKSFLKSHGLDTIGLKVSDMAEFYFGGARRVKKLQKLWKLLYQRGCSIWIITSNEGLQSHPNIFYQLLDSIGLWIPRHQMIYRKQLTKFQCLKILFT